MIVLVPLFLGFSAVELHTSPDVFAPGFVDVRNTIPIAGFTKAAPDFEAAVVSWKKSPSIRTARDLACLMRDDGQADRAVDLFLDSRFGEPQAYGLMLVCERLALQIGRAKEPGYQSRAWQRAWLDVLARKQREVMQMAETNRDIAIAYWDTGMSQPMLAKGPPAPLRGGGPGEVQAIVAARLLPSRNLRRGEPWQAMKILDPYMDQSKPHWRVAYLMTQAKALAGEVGEARRLAAELEPRLPANSVWRRKIVAFRRSGKASDLQERWDDFRGPPK